MSKGFFDKITGSRVFCIIFSVLAAVALWLYIGFVENADIAQTINGIPVLFVGEEDILADRSLMIIEGADQTVSLKITGKRNTVSKLDNTNMSVSVDLTNIKSPGKVSQVYTVNFPDTIDADSVSVTRWSPMYVEFTIAQRTTREIDVRGQIIGSVAEGYEQDAFECTPGTITVSGPEEIVNSVKYAFVGLERENVTKSISTTSGFVLIDYDGNSVPTDELILSAEEVAVEVRINMVKDVPLTVDIIEGGGAKEKNVVITYSPVSTIKLSGDATTVEAINKITLGTIDLSKFTVSTEQTYTIPIPDGVKNITGTKEVKVTVEVRGYSTKRVSATNIEVVNPPDGADVEIITKSVEVVVRGADAVINDISATNIRIVADLVDVSETTGNVTVSAKVYVDGYDNAGAIGEYTVVVSLS